MNSAQAVTDDVELMLQVQRGDHACFDLLVSRYWEKLVYFIQTRVRRRATAEELAQEAFLRAYLFRERYQPTARFSTWLFHIGGNLALNWLRDNRHEVACEEISPSPSGRGRFFDPAPSPSDVMIERQDYEALRRQVAGALASLPRRQREAVMLHRYSGFDYAGIARALDCSVPTVKSLLWRAHTTLRTRLAELDPSRLSA